MHGITLDSNSIQLDWLRFAISLSSGTAVAEGQSHVLALSREEGSIFQTFVRRRRCCSRRRAAAMLYKFHTWPIY